MALRGARPLPRATIRPPARYATRPLARRQDHARPIARTVPTGLDLRRLAATALSAFIPGLGQLINGRAWLARRLAVPFLILAAIVGLVVTTQSPTRLAATVVAPTTMSALLVLNAIVLAWRLVAVLHAFFDRRYPGRSGRLGAVGLVVMVAVVAAPHALAHSWGTAAEETFALVFATDREPGAGSSDAVVGPRAPSEGQRINVLVVGIDKTPSRTATLTDTLMVVSIDPIGETVSMLSVPRDLVGVPLGNGQAFGAKLNALYSYAERHRDRFPAGGMRTLEDAVGALLGIEIQYYAMMDFAGFVKMVDAVGGIDIDVQRGFYDPEYDGYGLNQQGWGVEPGRHHFTGYEALAYARARKGATETDFTRQARQQEILLALRNRALEAGSLLFHLPDLLRAVGGFITTDFPLERLPQVAAIADEMGDHALVHVVLQRPYVLGGVDPKLGSIQRPKLELIAQLSKELFTPPGTLPAALVTPAPSAASAAPPSAAATAP